MFFLFFLFVCLFVFRGGGLLACLILRVDSPFILLFHSCFPLISHGPLKIFCLLIFLFIYLNPEYFNFLNLLKILKFFPF